MKINKISEFVYYTIAPSDDIEQEKIVDGEYLGFLGLSTWLWCDRTLDDVLEDDERYFSTSGKLEKIEVKLSGDEAASLELLMRSVETFMNNCEV